MGEVVEIPLQDLIVFGVAILASILYYLYRTFIEKKKSTTQKQQLNEEDTPPKIAYCIDFVIEGSEIAHTHYVFASSYTEALDKFRKVWMPDGHKLGVMIITVRKEGEE